jgi:Zn-dependent protease/CBS domain-containing protein
MTRLPGNAPAGSGQHGGQGRPTGLRFAGFSIRLTFGGYLLALLAVIAGAVTLPAMAPGWPAVGYLAATAGLVIGLLGSLAAHELAHAITARRHGSAASEVAIGFFGGSSHARQDFPTARALGRVAAAGLLASLGAALLTAAAAFGLAAAGAGTLAVTVFAVLASVNALLTVASALPGPGLDGGKLVAAWTWARTGDRTRGTVTAARAGQYTGALLVAGGVALLALGYIDGLWVSLMGLLMAGTGRAQARQIMAVSAMSGLRVRDVLGQAAPAPVAAGWQTVQAFLDGEFGDGGSLSDGAVTHSRDLPVVSGAVAFAVRDWSGRPAGVLTLTQLAAVPADRRDSLRVSEVATPAADVVTATMDEPMEQLATRLAIRPATPAALHTAGHVLVIADDGTPAGVLSPADFARASQLGSLIAERPAP